MTSFWRDLRHALRFLRLSPGFTLVAVFTLALGIFANTALFQLIVSSRFRTIPVKNPQEFGTIRIADRHWGSGQFSSQYSQLTLAMWEQSRKRKEGFAEIAVWSDQRFNLATGGEVRKAKGIRVGGDFFHVLGVEPILGRLLGPADDQPGCGISGADISYAFWQRNFAGDPSVIGKRLTLDGNSFQVIGVTPPGFNGISIGDTFDVAVPICVEPILSPRNNRLTRRHAWWLATIGRLKPGWTIARANAQILAVTPAILQETIPTVYDAEATKKYLEYKLGAFSASTGFSELRSDSETSLWLLLGISGLVLLIACANLANLMLARASARERQIAIRRALGATRWRMVRELLSESLLLAAAGSTCGLFLAFAISRLLVAFISTEQNQIFLDLGMDWRVLAFTTGLAAMTTVSFGLSPALRLPFVGSTWNDDVINEGSDPNAGVAWENFLGPGYFKTVGTPLLAGRDFDDRDTSTSAKVAIVNQAFARKILKVADPLGKRFRIHEAPGKPRPLYEIVGVTADNKFQDMHEEFLPFMYFPSTQEEKPSPDDHILIRSSLPLTNLISSMKETIADVNPGIDLEFLVFQTRIQNSLIQDELMATLSSFFGFLAALLAAIGLYGVMSYMVIQRTKEIGIRMAIGAERSDVLRMILREATVLTVTGLVIGTGLALAAAQAAKSLLFGLKPRDPLTLVMAVVTLSAVAALASFLPAYRASKLDPLTALRYE